MSTKASKNTKPTILIILLVFFTAVAITFMLGASGKPSNHDSNEIIYSDSKQYDPEYMVVPSYLIGESLGTLRSDLTFDPLNIVPAKDDSVKANYGGVIPTGTQYFAVKGYEDKGCIAIEYGGNYFLYRHMPFYATWPIFGSGVEKISFTQRINSTSVLDKLSGSKEQAYMKSLEFVSNYQARYIVLDFTNAKLDNYDNLIAVYQEYCQGRGITLLLSSDGYIKQTDNGWVFEDGLLVSAGDASFTDEKSFVAVGVTAGPLAGSGYHVTLEKRDGVWVAIDVSMSWIS